MSHGVVDLLEIIYIQNEQYPLLIRILFHIFTNLTLCGHLVVQISQQIGVCLVFQDFAVFRDLYSYQHIDHRDHNKGCCNRYADLDDQIHNRTTEGLLNTGQIGFIDAYHQIPGCVRNGKMTENLTYAVLIDMQYPIVALLLLSVKQCPTSKTLCYPFKEFQKSFCKIFVPCVAP